jgi:hypothetical protein
MPICPFLYLLSPLSRLTLLFLCPLSALSPPSFSPHLSLLSTSAYLSLLYLTAATLLPSFSFFFPSPSPSLSLTAKVKVKAVKRVLLFGSGRVAKPLMRLLGEVGPEYLIPATLSTHHSLFILATSLPFCDSSSLTFPLSLAFSYFLLPPSPPRSLFSSLRHSHPHLPLPASTPSLSLSLPFYFYFLLSPCPSSSVHPLPPLSSVLHHP